MRPAMPSAPAEMIVPATIAPNRPNSGAYGERLPSGSSSGPKRVPSQAPAMNPPSDRTPMKKPRANPTTPKSTAKPMITMSTPVISMILHELRPAGGHSCRR